MTSTPISARRLLIWLGLAVVLVAAGAVTGRAFWRRAMNRTPVAAYLVPIDNLSRIKPAWWHSFALKTPRALRSGERVSVPAGASLKLVHTDTGVAELVTGPAKCLLQIKLPVETNTLVSPLTEVLATLTSPQPQPGSSAITSPVSVTRYLNPLVTWVAREGVLYDVAVADAADPFVPVRKASGVRPPIALADLETPQRHQLGIDRNYVVAVRETGSTTPAAGARFLTAANAELENKIPSAPTELIAEATAALAKKPYRTGDAWLALSRLPPDWLQSEPGVRLRLLVATELGLPDEFARARADAALLRSRP